MRLLRSRAVEAVIVGSVDVQWQNALADVESAVAHGKRVKFYPLGGGRDSTTFVGVYKKPGDLEEVHCESATGGSSLTAGAVASWRTATEVSPGVAVIFLGATRPAAAARGR